MEFVSNFDDMSLEELRAYKDKISKYLFSVADEIEKRRNKEKEKLIDDLKAILTKIGEENIDLTFRGECGELSLDSIELANKSYTIDVDYY